MNELTHAVASHVRSLRAQRGLSLSELARMAGLSKATLSALEQGSGNPTVDTVWALSQALNVPVGALMRTTDERQSTRVVRAGEGEELSGSVLNVRLLAQPDRASRIELLAATIIGHDARNSEPHAAGTVEHIIVREGRMTVGPIEDPVELHPGDYASFLADRPHLYRADSDSAAALIVIAYPPNG